MTISVLELSPHIISELEPKQLEPYSGIRIEVDDEDPHHALLGIKDFRTLDTLGNLLEYAVEVSPDLLQSDEEQNAVALKNTLQATVDAVRDEELGEGPYSYSLPVDEASVALHAITAKLEKDIAKGQARLWGRGYTNEQFEWLYSRDAEGQPDMVAVAHRTYGDRQQQIMQGNVEDENRIYHDRGQS